jgi:tetratricopeptide (TPR) repeat protein
MSPIVRGSRLLLLIVLLGVTTARADAPLARPSSPEALAHFEKAYAFYRVGDFKSAADEYKAGALIEPLPVFDYNLGQCFRQLGDYKAAIWHYEQYLKNDPAPGQRADAVKKFIEQMRAELDQKAMHERPTEPAMPATSPSAPVMLPPAPVERWYDDGFGWGLSGAGLIAAGVGVGFLIDASSLDDDANHTSNQQQQNTLRNEISTRSIVGAIVGIGGAGLLVTGIIKLAIHPSAPESNAVAWNVGVAPGEVFVFGRF